MRASFHDKKEAEERRARRATAKSNLEAAQPNGETAKPNQQMAEVNLEMAKPFSEMAEPDLGTAEPDSVVAEPNLEMAKLILEAADPPPTRVVASSSSVRKIVCAMLASSGPLAKALASRKGKTIAKGRAKKSFSPDPPTDGSDPRAFMLDAKKSLYDDGPGSANLFSMIKKPAISLPPPDVLVNS